MVYKKNINILITDYHCASNRGDAAILEGLVRSLKSIFPNSVIKVMTEYPESAKIINQVYSIQQKMVPFRWNKIRKNIASVYLLIGGSFFRKGINIFGIKPLMKKLSLESYLEAHLVISTGGSFLNDFYFPGNLSRFWGFYFAKTLGKPVAIYAQSIGPLNKPFCNWIARHILNKVDLIILRDKESYNIIDSLRINKPKKYLGVDASFNMNLLNRKILQKRALEKYSFSQKNKLMVSISVRDWECYKKKDGKDIYISSIAKLADWLVLEKKAKVIFASTCTNFDGYHHDDRVLAQKIIKKMEHADRENPKILFGEYTPQELSHFYGKMDLHIGTRMHSIILAMLSGTPAVAIQYEFKTGNLMKLFRLEDYLLDINSISFEKLTNLVEDALINKRKIRNEINTNLPIIRKLAKDQIKLIVDLINKE